MNRNLIISLALLLTLATGTSCSNDEKEDNVSLTVTGILDGYEYVDLGMPNGICWATYSIGANSITEYGDFFAWGETEAKDLYYWSSYKHCIFRADPAMKKYSKRTVFSNFPADYKYELDPEDDAATANWGDNWRMPTHKEMINLHDYCTWEWTYSYKGSGTAGMIGTSKINGNQIFMPAGGHSIDRKIQNYGVEATFFTKTLSTTDEKRSYLGDFTGGRIEFSNCVSERYIGRQIRAVCKKQ